VGVWEDLRERCPVAHTQRFEDAWLAVNHGDVVDVTHDTATFSSRIPHLFNVRPESWLGMPPITLDPPEHMPHRRLLLPMFTPAAVERLVPQTEALCDRLIDTFIDTGRADAGVDYAQHVPVLMTARLLGLPESDADRFRGWIHDLMRWVSVIRTSTPEPPVSS
jgi:cytochrome P450